MKTPLLLLLTLVATPLAAQTVAEVQVTPEALMLKVGQKQALFAAAFDPSGNLIPTARFSYASTNEAIAVVQSDGTVVGLEPGAAIVRVSAGQKSFNVAISVQAASAPTTRTSTAEARAPSGPPPAVLTIEPSPVYLLGSENIRLLVKAFHEDGSPAELPRLTWKSLTPEIATVDADGVVVGLAPGQAIVQASAGGVAATVPVEVAGAEFQVSPERLVLAPDDLDTLSATVPDQGGRQLRGGLQWRALDTAVLRVGPTGIVQALAPGETEVVVSGFFQEKRIPLRVHPPVQTLVVSPRPGAGSLVIPLHGTRTLSVRAVAADSSVVPEASLWWEVGDSSVARFDPTRTEITGVGAGTTSVTLRARGFDPISWVVEVVPGGIAIDHDLLSLTPGARVTLQASLVDDGGRSLGQAQDLTWSTSNIGVAVVGNDGIVEATGFGRAVITATTRWGRADSVIVMVAGDLIFSANRGGSRFGIYQLSLRDPGRVAPLVVDSFQNVQPAISPDRRTIAFSSNRDGDFDIYLVDMDGGNLRRVTSGPAVDAEPAWTPDGKRLVFASTRGGSTQICSVALNGTDLQMLTTSGGGNTAPTVSPDGRTIVFVSGRDGNDEIYRMDLDGANQTNLTGTREREVAPYFLPNGDLLFAAEVRRKGWQITRLPADQSGPVVVLEDSLPITGFAVSPDGQRVALVSGRVTDPRRGRAEFSFAIHTLGGGAPFAVPLLPNEQVVGPRF